MTTEARVAPAEASLVAAGVPRERWLYISANADYDAVTPVEHRLGGFSCDRRWLLAACEKYPQLFHTVVDGADLKRVLSYIGATSYFLKDTMRWVSGNEEITALVEKELENHKIGQCPCVKSSQ